MLFSKELDLVHYEPDYLGQALHFSYIPHDGASQSLEQLSNTTAYIMLPTQVTIGFRIK